MPTCTDHRIVGWINLATYIHKDAKGLTICRAFFIYVPSRNTRGMQTIDSLAVIAIEGLAY